MSPSAEEYREAKRRLIASHHVMSKNSPWVFTLGVAAGVVAGRFAPLLIANVAGAGEGALRGNPFASLIREHRALLAMLDKMENVGSQNWAKRKVLFLAFKRTIGKHALAEEDIVYPLLKTDAERHEATQKLYREHASMKIHLFELERAIHQDSEWTDAVRALRAEIEPHAREEEEIEFPRLLEVLSQARTAEVGRKIRQEEALII